MIGQPGLPAAHAADRRVGRSRWENGRDGFHHQQHGMGRLQRLRIIQKPLGDRGFLQTDLAGLRLPRPLQAGHPLAALVGPADVFAATFPCVVFGLATQLRTHLHHDTGRGMGQVRPRGDSGILWDSRRSVEDAGSTSDRIFTG